MRSLYIDSTLKITFNPCSANIKSTAPTAAANAAQVAKHQVQPGLQTKVHAVLAAAGLGTLLRRSIKKGKPDLNILFQYNMPLRALAKMTNGAISMGMVDGIVMELQGFWIIGLVRVIVEAVKNIVLNSRMEERLKNS